MILDTGRARREDDGFFSHFKGAYHMGRKKGGLIMHRTALVSITLAVYLGMAGIASAYSLNNLGSAGGWDNITGGSTTFVIDSSDLTTDGAIGSTRVLSALTNAHQTWDAVTSATTLSFSAKADLGGNYDVFDGPGGQLDQNADYRYANITWGGWLPNSYFTDLFGASGNNVLAVTWTGQIRVNRTKTWVADIYFNDNFSWSDDGTGFDIETVALHELGHALGLGHEDDVPSIMNSYYAGIQRSLLADDISGITALYSTTTSSGGKGGGKGNSKKLLGPEADGLLLAGVTYATIPEPASLLLVGLGGLTLLRRRGSGCRS
jgi:hypothetical protein